MRDPARIERILNKIGVIWEKNPDLRFGQLMYCLFDLFKVEKDIFIIEDDKLEETLNKKI